MTTQINWHNAKFRVGAKVASDRLSKILTITAQHAAAIDGVGGAVAPFTYDIGLRDDGSVITVPESDLTAISASSGP